MNNKYHYFLLGIAISSIIGFGLYSIDRQDAKRVNNLKRLIEPSPSYETFQVVRGYNYEVGGFHNYTDEEIRALRNQRSYRSDGSYIKTPGRKVLSQQEVIDQYIEDNIEDILDDY